MKSETDNSSEANVNQQLDRYRKLAHISTDWLWETDANSKISYISDSVEQITGLSKQYYMGASGYNLVSQETKLTAEWRDLVEKVARKVPIKKFDYKHIGADGKVVYLRLNAIPVFHDDGCFRGYLGSAVDISELVFAKKPLEEINSELEVAKEIAETLARTDALTGLNNRRAFVEHSKAVDDMARRYGRGYSIIMIDIDYFKKINDTYGHAVGDTVISAVANRLRNHVRSSDIPGRIGGEEFAVILPQTMLESAGILAKRLRQSIASNGIDIEQGTLSVTVSLGVAQFRESMHSVEEVISLADKALYEAKRQG